MSADIRRGLDNRLVFVCDATSNLKGMIKKLSDEISRRVTDELLKVFQSQQRGHRN